MRRFVAEGERAAELYALAIPRRSRAGSSQLGIGTGSSWEFHEHREYQPGDDLRHIDWPAYGRSDRLMVKLYREETQPHLDLLIDGSRSMALAASEKARAAVALTSFLARAASRSGMTHDVWLAGDGCRSLRAADGALAGEELVFDFPGDLVESLDRSAPRWRPLGVRAVVSDLLWRHEPRGLLARLGRGAAAVWIVQLVAEADLAPRASGFARLRDAESGRSRDLLVDAAAVARYRKAFEAHRTSWQRACREAGAVMVTLVAERLVAGWSSESLGDLLRLGLIVPAGPLG